MTLCFELWPAVSDCSVKFEVKRKRVWFKRCEWAVFWLGSPCASADVTNLPLCRRLLARKACIMQNVSGCSRDTAFHIKCTWTQNACLLASNHFLLSSLLVRLILSHYVHPVVQLKTIRALAAAQQVNKSQGNGRYPSDWVKSDCDVWALEYIFVFPPNPTKPCFNVIKPPNFKQLQTYPTNFLCKLISSHTKYSTVSNLFGIVASQGNLYYLVTVGNWLLEITWFSPESVNV